MNTRTLLPEPDLSTLPADYALTPIGDALLETFVAQHGRAPGEFVPQDWDPIEQVKAAKRAARRAEVKAARANTARKVGAVRVSKSKP